MYKKILVPLDGSELAEQVLPHATALAELTGAELVLLRVIDTPTYDYLMTAPELGASLRTQAESEATEYIQRKGNELRAAGFNITARAVNDGAVHATILRQAEKLGVDLIAMSTHGRSGLARMVMGSIADDVVRHATLPVLLVRPQPVRASTRQNAHAVEPMAPH